jgi:hypothetical protein
VEVRPVSCPGPTKNNTMKQYKVTFWLKGQYIETTVTANGYWKAKEMVRSMYPTATNINATELR